MRFFNDSDLSRSGNYVRASFESHHVSTHIGDGMQCTICWFAGAAFASPGLSLKSIAPNRLLHTGKVWAASLSEALVPPLESLCCFKVFVCLKTSDNQVQILRIVG